MLKAMPMTHRSNHSVFAFHWLAWILLLLLTFTYQPAVSLTTQQIEPRSSRMLLWCKSKKKSWSSIWVMCKYSCWRGQKPCVQWLNGHVMSWRWWCWANLWGNEPTVSTDSLVLTLGMCHIVFCVYDYAAVRWCRLTTFPFHIYIYIKFFFVHSIYTMIIIIFIFSRINTFTFEPNLCDWKSVNVGRQLE